MASSPADVLALTLARVDWDMEGSTHLATDTGERYDLLRTPPHQLQKLVEAAAVRASDRIALSRLGTDLGAAGGSRDSDCDEHPGAPP
eukprot:2641949-Pyramimonas_sp.AAC.1